MSMTERKERGLNLLHEMLGTQRAEQTLKHWREICPDFGDYVVEFLSGEIWSRPGLDRRTKSLVTIATLAALGRTRALELNLRFASNNGVTKQDVAETLLQIAPYAGFPVCWEGLAMAHEIYGESSEGPGS